MKIKFRDKIYPAEMGEGGYPTFTDDFGNELTLLNDGNVISEGFKVVGTGELISEGQ